jgi:hypothetical protein
LDHVDPRYSNATAPTGGGTALLENIVSVMQQQAIVARASSFYRNLSLSAWSQFGQKYNEFRSSPNHIQLKSEISTHHHPVDNGVCNPSLINQRPRRSTKQSNQVNSSTVSSICLSCRCHELSRDDIRDKRRTIREREISPEQHC